MYKVLQAICENGNLVFSEKLGLELEGKQLKVILIEADIVESKKEQFVKLVEEHSFVLPENYQFNRENMKDKVMLDTNIWVYLSCQKSRRQIS